MKTLDDIKNECAIKRGFQKYEGFDYCNQDFMDEVCLRYATQKQIEENESLLAMAKLHMDERAVVVIQDRIDVLGVQDCLIRGY